MRRASRLRRGWAAVALGLGLWLCLLAGEERGARAQPGTANPPSAGSTTKPNPGPTTTTTNPSANPSPNPGPTTNPGPSPTTNPGPTTNPNPPPTPTTNPHPPLGPDPSPSLPASPAPPPLPPSPAPAADPAVLLRHANAAAQVGDWGQVDRLTAPLIGMSLRSADLAEVHRLRGLAAFFAQRLEVAEAELLAYLRLDADAHLDPATVPPEAITYFESVQAKHRAELRTLRASRAPRKRSFLLTLVPVAGQLQNGERSKAWGFGITLGALAVTNVTSYVLLRRWCREADGTCDRTGVDRSGVAKPLSVVNLLSGVGLGVIYGVAVFDAIIGYRRATHLTPMLGEGNVGLSFVRSF